jgi:hypothetical protein
MADPQDGPELYSVLEAHDPYAQRQTGWAEVILAPS